MSGTSDLGGSSAASGVTGMADGGVGAAGAAGGATAGVEGNISGAASSVPGKATADAMVPGMPATPAVPDAESLTPAEVRSPEAAMGTATVAVGADGAVADVKATQGTAGELQSAAQDPQGAATAEVKGRVDSAVSARTPADPTADARADVETARGVADNPEAAAKAEVRSAVDAKVPDPSVNVQVEGSVGTSGPKTK